MSDHQKFQSMLGRHEADPRGANRLTTARRYAISPMQQRERVWEQFARQQRAGGPFQRGVNDCCTWAAKWAACQLGVPRLDCDWLGKPLTDDDAQAIIDEQGGLEAAVDAVLLTHGFEKWPEYSVAPPFAIALLKSHGGFSQHTLGIVRDNFVLTRSEPRGRLASGVMMRTVPLTQILTAWHLPL